MAHPKLSAPLAYSVHLSPDVKHTPRPLDAILRSDAKHVFIAGANLHSLHTFKPLRDAMLHFLAKKQKKLQLLLCDPRFRHGVETWTDINPRTEKYNHKTHLAASIKYFTELCNRFPTTLEIRVTNFVPVGLTFVDPGTTQGLMILTPVVHEGQVSLDRPSFIVRASDNDPAFEYYWRKHERLFTDDFSCLLPIEQGIFISHGRSKAWEKLATYLARAGLSPIEFDYTSPVGKLIPIRLQEMLAQSSAGVIIMTAEDDRRLKPTAKNPTTLVSSARENVIHEAGLSMAAFGVRRTVLLVEKGCTVPSNLDGIVQIRFAKGRIKSTFPKIRQMLKDESLIP